MDDTSSSKLRSCFKGLRRATRLLIRHVRNLRRLRYGKALLRLLVKKTPSAALKSILRTTEEEKDTNILPTDQSIIRDEITSHLIIAPDEVVAKIAQMETAAFSPDPALPPGAPFPWLGHVRPTHASSIPMIFSYITSTIMQEALRRTPSHKAVGPDGVPGLILKHMSPVFHEVLHLLFQSMAITGITPPSWLKSHAIFLYKKRDPTRLDIYHPITLANASYKLKTTFTVTLATEYIEARKILSPEEEGFRADRSCSRAITHLILYVEDAHSHKKDVVLCYLNFKVAFPSTDHIQLVRVLDFLGLSQDFTRLVSKLYSEAATEFVTPPPRDLEGETSKGIPYRHLCSIS